MPSPFRPDFHNPQPPPEKEKAVCQRCSVQVPAYTLVPNTLPDGRTILVSNRHPQCYDYEGYTDLSRLGPRV